MIRCKTCVLPDSRPDTPFIDGECSACISYRKRPIIDWDERKRQLLALLGRHGFRCIVPSSGGKDSTAQVIKLQELGCDVTVVTARTCQLTSVGRENIDNLARYARTIEVVPNMTVRAKLNRLGLELVGDISWPEHSAIFTTPFKMSVALGIPLLWYGENPQNQYGGPMGSEEAMQMTQRWVSEFGGFLGLRTTDVVGMEGITATDMLDYQMPRGDDLSRVGTEAHFLGQYLPWDSNENAMIAARHGMKRNAGYPPCYANWWDHENLDNAQTGLHDYFMFRKYGFGRGCQQISVDVRSGLIDRDVAMKWLEKHEGAFPFVYGGVPVEDVLDRIGMSREQLEKLANQFSE